LMNNGGDIRTTLGNSVIYLLIGPAFGTYIFRSAAIGQYKYFAETALDRIDDILDYKDITYGQAENESGELEFKNVSFSYSKEKVLDNISFKINKGETVALVGSSGGGKTTIARLAARFYDADEGEVLVGGINIKDYDKKSLMKKTAFVFQNSTLFKMSLRENLLLGNENATENEIETALINSGSKEIVDNLENGLDTVYGTKGTYFSG
ncbi:ABC transporter, ATP-binding protein, partial [Fusobacterium sp. CM21]